MTIEDVDNAKKKPGHQELNFSYDKTKPNTIGLNCVMSQTPQVILVETNGAGKKSFLLRILTGQIFIGFNADSLTSAVTRNKRPGGIGFGRRGKATDRFEGCARTPWIVPRVEVMEKWQDQQGRNVAMSWSRTGDNNWRMHEVFR
jgi:hypothetical protein